MTYIRLDGTDNQVLDVLMDRPQNVEQVGARMGGVTTRLLLSIQKLKAAGYIYVSGREKDQKGRSVAIYSVVTTKGAA